MAPLQPLRRVNRYPAVVLTAESAKGKQQRGLHRPCGQDRLLIGCVGAQFAGMPSSRASQSSGSFRSPIVTNAAASPAASSEERVRRGVEGADDSGVEDVDGRNGNAMPVGAAGVLVGEVPVVAGKVPVSADDLADGRAGATSSTRYFPAATAGGERSLAPDACVVVPVVPELLVQPLIAGRGRDCQELREYVVFCANWLLLRKRVMPPDRASFRPDRGAPERSARKTTPRLMMNNVLHLYTITAPGLSLYITFYARAELRDEIVAIVRVASGR